MSNKEFISFCGDTCSVCPRYQATINNDAKKLAYLAELWYRLGFRDHVVKPHEMTCKGCSRDKDCTHGINNCPEIASINNCGECSHYPCDKINKVFERTNFVNKTCKDKCSTSEYIILDRAFLSKKKTLDRINFLISQKA
jgi:hypothetical protein